MSRSGRRSITNTTALTGQTLSKPYGYLLMNMIAVTSSNIDAVGYDPDTKLLQINFLNGTSYQYDGVPEYVAQGLVDASSVGQYFNANVKDSYGYTKL